MDYSRNLKKKGKRLSRSSSVKELMMERSTDMKVVDAMTANLVVEVMNAATSFHKLHLQVTGDGSYAQHKALNEIYDKLPDLADEIAEGYQGACELILNYPEKAPVTLSGVDGAIEYLRMMKVQIDELQAVMPHSEIVNNLDIIKDAVNSAKYKLIFLS
jgi:hypothetical protein